MKLSDEIKKILNNFEKDDTTGNISEIIRFDEILSKVENLENALKESITALENAKELLYQSGFIFKKDNPMSMAVSKAKELL